MTLGAIVTYMEKIIPKSLFTPRVLTVNEGGMGRNLSVNSLE